jgi:hypothetical protein
VLGCALDCALPLLTAVDTDMQCSSLQLGSASYLALIGVQDPGTVCVVIFLGESTQAVSVREGLIAVSSHIVFTSLFPAGYAVVPERSEFVGYHHGALQLSEPFSMLVPDGEGQCYE